MADDIKINLGLNIADLVQGLNNAIADLNKLILVADKADIEVKQIGTELIDIDTAPAEQALQTLGKEAEETSSVVKNVFSMDNLKASFVGGLAGGAARVGLDSVITGIKALGNEIVEGALRADAFGDQLEVAFSQQGVKDIQGEIEKVRASSLGLANDLGMPVQRTRELASTVAQLGGVTGAQAEGLTKLAAGIETFTDGTVKGEAVAKAFSRGLADPEGAAAIEALSKKYPQLAETLKSTLSPTEKLAEANKILGTSFETVKNQQSDAGGTFNQLSNSVSEAFESIGTKVYETLNTLIPILSGTLMPIFDFISTNLGTIGAIVGTVAGAFILYNSVLAITSGITTLTTSISTTYAAVQVALGGSISIATVAQYALNLAMSLNPIGAVVVVAAALTAGIYALSSALTISAAETREQSEENVKLIESQQNSNQEQTNAVKSTKALADEFLSLSKKKKLTAEESAKLKTLTKDLSAEYPDLVKNTSSYKENLDGVESIANRAGDSLKGLAAESAKLDNALKAANQTLSFAKRNEAIEQAQNATENLVGYVTDPNARKAIDEFASALYDTKSAGAAADALNKATKSGYLNAEQIQAITSAYTSQVQALDAYKKTAETVVVTNKKVNDSTKPKGGTAKEVATDLDKALEAYKTYSLQLETQREIDVQAEKKRLNLSVDETSAYRQKKLLEDTAKSQDKLNELFAGIKTQDFQASLTVKPNIKEGETTTEITKQYNDIFLKNQATLEKAAAIKPTVDKDALKETEEFYKKIAESIGEQTKVNVKLIQDVASQAGATSEIELAKTTEGVQQLTDVIQGQLQALRDQLAAAQIAGADKAAELFQKQIDEQQKNLDALILADENYRIKSKESIKNNTLEYQVQTALQTSFLDEFNYEKLRKERETNEAIKKERLGALDAEEKYLNKSLAKREISAEDYAAKLANINKGREEAESKTNKSALDNLKKVGEQTAASVLKSQGDIFKKNAEKMEGNEKVFNEFVGNTLNQFSVLAASGTATLADFGAAAAGAAFDAVAAMIPSFVTGILGTSVVTLGPILGPLAAASLTGVLYGLLGLARSAAGFKDGVVGLDGGGTETSDSIPAWLSRGESVITAKATRNNKEELEFMNRTGLSIGELYRSNMPTTSVSVTPDGDLIREVRKLREETRGLGMRIQRNTNVEVSGVLTADSKSINAMIVQQKRREARR
jgi:hypothetical protein